MNGNIISSNSNSITIDWKNYGEGTYQIEVNFIDDVGCIADAITYDIIVNKCTEFGIWIPNAFTPDGDISNDHFVIDGYGFDLNSFTGCKYIFSFQFVLPIKFKNMKVKIIKENEVKKWTWYNEIKPMTYKCKRGNGNVETVFTDGVPSKVGNIYDVTDYDVDHFLTVKKVFGGKIKGLIRKQDCKIISEQTEN